MLKCKSRTPFTIIKANLFENSDSVIYFQITNPYRAAFGISDLRQALVERAQTTLRHVVGARAVQSVVTEREAIAFEIAEIVGDVADKWGVSIEGILIKDIIFSPEVAASLSSAAQQKRIGESKVIAARAEVDAARLMRQAADILASPAAMQIRQLEACTFFVILREPLSYIYASLQCNLWPSLLAAKSSLCLCNFRATLSDSWVVNPPALIQVVF
jgi:regulator of protease activity HflC (stomatin/prohibitin superfamily)